MFLIFSIALASHVSSKPLYTHSAVQQRKMVRQIFFFFFFAEGGGGREIFERFIYNYDYKCTVDRDIFAGKIFRLYIVNFLHSLNFVARL